MLELVRGIVRKIAGRTRLAAEGEVRFAGPDFQLVETGLAAAGCLDREAEEPSHDGGEGFLVALGVYRPAEARLPAGRPGILQDEDVRTDGRAGLAASQENDALRREFVLARVVKARPHRLVADIGGAVGEFLLIDLGDFGLVVARRRITVAVEDITRVGGVRKESAPPREPDMLFAARLRTPCENVAAGHVFKPGVATSREIRKSVHAAEVAEMPPLIPFAVLPFAFHLDEFGGSDRVEFVNEESRAEIGRRLEDGEILS